MSREREEISQTVEEGAPLPLRSTRVVHHAVTLEEIAAEAGVSKMTVSKVLNGKNKENRPSAIRRGEQIRAIAARLGYRPHAAARATATGRFHNIGILFGSDDPGFLPFRDTIHALMETFRRQEITMSLVPIPDTQLTSEGYVPRMLREWSTDGFLIHYLNPLPVQMRELLERHRIPAIWLNSKLESDCVYPNDYEAGRLATKYLVKCGHRRIVYVNQAPNLHYSIQDRLDGYAAVMRESGLTPRFWLGSRNGDPLPPPMPEWQAVSREWLREPDPPTAAVCYEAFHALSLYSAALSLGLTVPGDLSIIAMHDRSIMQAGVRITTCQIPALRLGEMAAELMLRKVAAPDEPISPCPVPFSIIPGVTCTSPTNSLS